MLEYFNYYCDNKRLCLTSFPCFFFSSLLESKFCVPPCRRWHGTIPCLQHHLGPGDPPAHMTRPTCFLWVDNICSFLKITSKFPFTYHRVLYMRSITYLFKYMLLVSSCKNNSSAIKSLLLLSACLFRNYLTINLLCLDLTFPWWFFVPNSKHLIESYFFYSEED